MADISKITLPSGTTYDIKDAVAREIASGALQFRGVTTTAITDGSTTTSYVVNGETLTAANGDLVIYDKKEFVFTTSDNKWHELGDNSAFKALAYKDTASATYTPAGTVSQPTFSGSSMSSTGNFTPSGTIAVNESSGTGTAYTPEGSIAVNASSGSGTAYTPEGSIAVNASSGSGTSYTPEGSVAAPTISVATAGSTTTIKNPTKVTVAKSVVAAAPGETAPSNALTYYSVSGETLSLYQLGYTTGDSITTSNVTVKTGDAAYEATAPEFTGTEKKLAFTGTQKKLAFTGTQKKLAFTGTQGSVSVSGTPEGTVSQPTFTGTEATITVS